MFENITDVVNFYNQKTYDRNHVIYDEFKKKQKM